MWASWWVFVLSLSWVHSAKLFVCVFSHQSLKWTSVSSQWTNGVDLLKENTVSENMNKENLQDDKSEKEMSTDGVEKKNIDHNEEKKSVDVMARKVYYIIYHSGVSPISRMRLEDLSGHLGFTSEQCENTYILNANHGQHVAQLQKFFIENWLKILKNFTAGSKMESESNPAMVLVFLISNVRLAVDRRGIPFKIAVAMSKQVRKYVGRVPAVSRLRIGLFHKADEQLTVNSESFYDGNFDFILRNYFSPSLARSKKVLWVPLSPALRDGAATSVSNKTSTDPLQPASTHLVSKDSLFFFCGTRARAGRPKMFHAVEHFLKRKIEGGKIGTAKCEVGEAYERAMGKAYFSLVPCGNSMETYRFWESLQVGNVLPVVEECPHTNFLPALFDDDQRDGNMPFLTVKNWSALEKVVEDIFQTNGETTDMKFMMNDVRKSIDSEKFLNKVQKLQQWFRKFQGKHRRRIQQLMEGS